MDAVSGVGKSTLWVVGVTQCEADLLEASEGVWGRAVDICEEVEIVGCEGNVVVRTGETVGVTVDRIWCSCWVLREEVRRLRARINGCGRHVVL